MNPTEATLAQIAVDGIKTELQLRDEIDKLKAAPPAPAPPPAPTTLRGIPCGELAGLMKNDPQLFARLQREDARRHTGGARTVASSGHGFGDAQFAVPAAGASWPGSGDLPLHRGPAPWDSPPAGAKK